MITKAALPFLNQMQADLASLGDNQETVTLVAAETIEDNSWVGIADDGQVWSITPFDPAAISTVSTPISGALYGGRCVKCKTLTDHFVMSYYVAATTLRVLLVKIVNGQLTVVGSERSITDVDQSEDFYVDLATVIDSDEKLVVAWRKDSDTYMGVQVFTIASDGLAAGGSVVSPASAVANVVSITEVDDNLLWIGTDNYNMLGKVAISALTVGAAFSDLAGSGNVAYCGMTDDDYLILVDTSEVHLYSYNTSTLAGTEVDAEAPGVGFTSLVGGGQFTDGTYYVTGYYQATTYVYRTILFSVSGTTITIDGYNDISYYTNDIIGIRDDLNLVNTGDLTTTVYQNIRCKNGATYLSVFDTYADSAANDIDTIIFRQFQIDPDIGMRPRIDALYGNLESTVYDMALNSVITMINPCMGIIMAQGVAVCLLTCSRLGYVLSGGDADDSVTVYTKGYVAASVGHNIVTCGQGVTLAGANISQRPSGEVQAVAYTLGSLPTGWLGKNLAYNLGTKIYLTGSEVW